MTASHPIVGDERNAAVGPGTTQLCGPRSGRTGLAISPGSTAAVWVSFRGPAAVGVGIRLAPNTAPFVLDAAQALGIVDEINAISEGATQSIGVWEWWT